MVAVRGPDSDSQLPLESGDAFPRRKPSFSETYEEILSNLRRKLSLFVWQGFFEPLSPISFENDTLVIQAPSSFHKDWINDHYLIEIVETASAVYKRSVQVSLTIPDKEILTQDQKPAAKQKIKRKLSAPIVSLSSSSSQNLKERIRQNQNIPQNGLNPNYTFEAFVSGPSNQMAYTAAQAIGEHSETPYSPLFLFGPAGLGKTHLLHAIGNDICKRRPEKRILYMSSEQWVNAYVQSIRTRGFEDFRRRFRNSCDVLLIDDIQFLAGKDASQDEFFHTFNALHQAHKQIIVTSDKYPHEIPGLEERLKTRLSWGLIADIRPPEIETRIAILQRKAESCQISLPEEVVYFLASKSTNSVRELEGSLLRLSAFSTISKTPITLSKAQEYLTPIFRKTAAAKNSPEKICEVVASYFDLSQHDLVGKSRIKQIVTARQLSIYLCRTHLGISLPELGRFFGGRDHSTILSSLRKVELDKKTDITLQTILARLNKSLGH